MFKQGVGRSDLESGNELELTESLEYLFKRFENETVIYPGHGGISTIGAEKILNHFI